jgi:hypothetical protein
MNQAEFKDIISHTKGFFETIKMYNDSTKTKMCAIDDEQTILFYATLKNHEPNLKDAPVGINRMDVLHGMLNYSGFNETGATFEQIVESKDNLNILSELKFTSPTGNNSSYRFMGSKIVETRVKVPAFNGITGDVVYRPTLKMISDLAHFSGILGGRESKFTATTSKGKLEFHIGSTGNDRASITVCDTNGVLKKNWSWNLAKFISILKLNDGGICTVSICNQALIMVEMESDHAFYQYLMPANK